MMELNYLHFSEDRLPWEGRVRINSIFFKNQMNNTNLRIEQALKRITTGSRLNRFQDGAADLARAHGIEVRLQGDQVGNKNIDTNLEILNLAESQINQIRDQLMSLQEIALAAQEENPSKPISEVSMKSLNLSSALTSASQMFQSGLKTIDSLTKEKAANGKALFDGNFESQFISSSNRSDQFSYQISELSLESLGLEGLGIANQNEIEESLKKIEIAFEKLDTVAASIQANKAALTTRKEANSSRMEIFTESLDQLISSDPVTDSAELVQLESQLKNQQVAFEQFLYLTSLNGKVFFEIPRNWKEQL